jgi:hypothetical protein
MLLPPSHRRDRDAPLNAARRVWVRARSKDATRSTGDVAEQKVGRRWVGQRAQLSGGHHPEPDRDRVGIADRGDGAVVVVFDQGTDR